MPSHSSEKSDAGCSGSFATTQWSVVLAAGDVQHQQSREALSKLCQAYWFPLYAYVRRRVSDVDEAQELTQEFFAELLGKSIIASAVQERGRFRAFLLTALKHFLSKQWDKQRSLKRGGGKTPISLDFKAADSSLCIEPAKGLTAEQLFDQQWAITLLQIIMQRLAVEFDARGKLAQFEALKGFIVGEQAGVAYSQLAITLGTTEAATKQTVSRMRRRYRELLRQEIAQTVTNPGEVEDEIANLFTVLAL